MVCVYGLSHAPALLLLEFRNVHRPWCLPAVFFLVMVTVAAQIWRRKPASRWLRRRPVARHIDRDFLLPRLVGRCWLAAAT